MLHAFTLVHRHVCALHKQTLPLISIFFRFLEQHNPTKPTKVNPICYSVTITVQLSSIAEIGDRARAKWAEKWGDCYAPFRGGAGSPSNIMPPGWDRGLLRTIKWNVDPSNRLAKIHQRYRQTVYSQNGDRPKRLKSKR